MENKHYFSNNDDMASKPIEYQYTVQGKTLTFQSDLGVFSKDELDFGSHVFIQTLLKEKLSGKGLDMGCGIGPIGLSMLVGHNDVEMDMVDINNRAIRLCQSNVERNNLKANVFLSNGFEYINKKYDFIISNPPIRQGKGFLFQFYTDSKAHLKSSGCLYIVIRKQQGAASSVKKLEEVFGNCSIIEKKAGYWILKSIHEG
ncbi:MULTISPECIES: class I SAM-dependent methyltransferase [Terrabacteria group]|uniref:class I SAM-dependent methyltransferase n=1 Tax=Bacillati TaxID=1783272 RepID=UPI001C6E05AB|nr:MULTISPECIES: methyltransferase [Terrabacteria group]MBW9212436.1 methyltransferase [Trueperella sp. zg.1013]